MPIVAYVGDIHAGSLQAVCPPEVDVGRGGVYRANDVQRYLYDHWLAYWQTVETAAGGGEVWGVVGGEFCEGAHHRSTEVVSVNIEVQRRIARMLFDQPRKIVSRWWVVRGSQAHAGESGRDDENLAAFLGAEPANGEDLSREVVKIAAGGHRLRFQHHAWGSMRPWTRGGNALRLAAALTYEHFGEPDEAPHLAVYGHYHDWLDTGDAHPVRVIYCGGWKAPDAYVLKIEPTDRKTVAGGLVIHAHEGEPLAVDKVRVTLKRRGYQP